ncbi:hypothetical protein H4O18_09145 [Arenibacter sp. BSSL-BM3]|uniref:YD repeat-containing protein n=1 Tax=Arenibacter arenosicollis TaxID=2762274 RepID=A0ABR7QLT8_9FLAO|nr:hypothetical protein [Arenibacter arenosicollis]MBC8768156.1 hypothetical protein [Arenibacter arenosicollis]
MIKNYLPIILLCISNILGLSSPASMLAQEIKVFTVQDFDLNGPVKSCLVATDYGKEEYDFNEEGFLTKAVTRYNDTDYDITQYKLNGSQLLEKRVENYRDGIFVKNTSIANFYELDTTEGKKITEKIISYNKEFLDQYEYFFGEDGRISTIKRINDSGIDETAIKYEAYKGEFTETYYLNDIIFKSIRTSKVKGKDNAVQKLILTKEFLEGQPQIALEQTYNSNNKLVSEKKFTYNLDQKTFVPTASSNYTYNNQGMLTSLKNTNGKSVKVQEYIYQYDSHESGNWIKQIITPDNTYKTRKIKYYQTEPSKEDKS